MYLTKQNIDGSVFLHLVRNGVMNPVHLTEGALVDLGFAGLIEQIEERLGPGMANLVLLAVTALILILVDRYTAEAIAVFDGLTGQDNLYSQFLGYAGFVALYGFFVLAGDQYFRVRARQVEKETTERIEERMMAEKTEREAALAEAHRIQEEHRTSQEATLAEMRHMVQEIEEKVRSLNLS